MAEGAATRYPEGVPDKVTAILKHELRLIETLQLQRLLTTGCGVSKHATKLWLPLAVCRVLDRCGAVSPFKWRSFEQTSAPGQKQRCDWPNSRSRRAFTD